MQLVICSRASTLARSRSLIRYLDGMTSGRYPYLWIFLRLCVDLHSFLRLQLLHAGCEHAKARNGSNALQPRDWLQAQGSLLSLTPLVDACAIPCAKRLFCQSGMP